LRLSSAVVTEGDEHLLVVDSVENVQVPSSDAECERMRVLNMSSAGPVPVGTDMSDEPAQVQVPDTPFLASAAAESETPYLAGPEHGPSVLHPPSGVEHLPVPNGASHASSIRSDAVVSRAEHGAAGSGSPTVAPSLHSHEFPYDSM